MIKKILVAILVALPMLASAQTLKIGLVDTNAIIGLMPETQAAQVELEEVSKKYQEEGAKMEDEMRRLYEEYQNMRADELPAIRERKAQEIQTAQQKMDAFAQSASQDLQKRQNDKMAPIIDKLKKAIESVGKEGNYSYVTANDPALIFYYQSPVEDITPLVKAKLGL